MCVSVGEGGVRVCVSVGEGGGAHLGALQHDWLQQHPQPHKRVGVPRRMWPRDDLVPPNAVVPRLVPQETHERVEILVGDVGGGGGRGGGGWGGGESGARTPNKVAHTSMEFWIGVPVSPHRCSADSRHAARDAPVDLHLIVCPAAGVKAVHASARPRHSHPPTHARTHTPAPRQALSASNAPQRAPARAARKVPRCSAAGAPPRRTRASPRRASRTT